jgi:gliding motility-associated lipoprotein GldH
MRFLEVISKTPCHHASRTMRDSAISKCKIQNEMLEQVRHDGYHYEVFLKWHVFSFLAITILLSGCDSNRVFEDYVEFKERTWKVQEPVSFEFEISNTQQPYNLYYEVRNSLDYPWQRIFVQYQLTDSTGTTLSNKLVSNYLFEKSGEPLGRSGLGDVYDHRFIVLPNYSFTQPGKYKFTITQENREDTLAGILAIGFRVETALEN